MDLFIYKILVYLFGKDYANDKNYDFVGHYVMTGSVLMAYWRTFTS
jgi:hypothetical protein